MCPWPASLAHREDIGPRLSPQPQDAGAFMTFKVQVGPPQIAIHHAMTVLVTEPNGEIMWPSDKGLYLLDTRLISAWAVQANGESWELLNGGAVYHDTAKIYLTNLQLETEDG